MLAKCHEVTFIEKITIRRSDLIVDMQRFTHLGRPVDITYPTNRAIAAISLSVLIGVGIWGLFAQGLLLSDVLLQGMGFAGAVFLTWALGREFDPDGEMYAFFPIPLTILLVYWLGQPDFTLLFLCLLLMRVVNRTIGLAAKPGDVFFVLVIMTWSARDGAWYIVLCTAVAFALDSFLVQSHRSHSWVAMLVGVAAILLFLKKGWLFSFSSLSALLLWMVVGGVLGVSAMLLFISEIRSQSDHSGPIYLQRLQASWLLALLLALLTVCLHPQGFAAIAPIWSVFIVIGGYRLQLKILNR